MCVCFHKQEQEIDFDSTHRKTQSVPHWVGDVVGEVGGCAVPGSWPGSDGPWLFLCKAAWGLRGWAGLGWRGVNPQKHAMQ